MNIKKAINYCNNVDKVTDNAILFFAPYFILGGITLVSMKVFDSYLIPITAGIGCLFAIGFWIQMFYKLYYLKEKYNLEWQPLEGYVARR